MVKHTAEWWRERVDELEAGEDAAAIAGRHGVRPRLVGWWRSEFARRARKTTGAGQKLLPVVVGPPPTVGRRERVDARDGATVEVVIEAGAARLTLRGAATADQLEALTRGLVSRC